MERKQSDFCKDWKSNKGKNRKIANRIACQMHQCKCANKIVLSDTEFSRLIQPQLEIPVCNFKGYFISIKSCSVATCILIQQYKIFTFKKQKQTKQQQLKTNKQTNSKTNRKPTQKPTIAYHLKILWQLLQFSIYKIFIILINFAHFFVVPPESYKTNVKKKRV